MKIRKKYLAKILVLLLTSTLMLATSVDKNGKNTQKLDNASKVSTNGSVGDSYLLDINKISLPMNSRGIIADVKAGGSNYGVMDGKVFLYSAGFFLSGVNDKGIMWSNANASASRTEDYLPGNAAWDTANDVQISDETYAGMYVIKVSDTPFGDSWVAWGEAVAAGAYFYDGDGDGNYNPVDKNGNGVWDPDEDSPDILGDETVWCVYNDSQPQATRNFSNVEAQGIEVRQTVWAYSADGDLGNIIFVRYSLLNTGLVADIQDSVFLGIWADPDLGDPYDDLVGADTALNAGYVYNDGPDKDFGENPPAFLIDFFQGPWGETGDPTDFALNTKGPILGVDTIWGNKNVPMTSFVHYMQSHPTQGDPDNETQARSYLQGFNQQGEVVDPCNWEFGTVYQMDCATVDPRYLYSGDPVVLSGWINNTGTDQRQMSNTGPFKLVKDVPVDIVVAYVAGRAGSAVASVKEAKKIDRAAQFVFQNNFNVPSAPPAVEPIAKAGDNSIELIWETYPHTVEYRTSDKYKSTGVGFDMFFEWYEVKMYQSSATSDINAGRVNTKLIARYDVKNDINAVIYENPVNSERTLLYDHGGTQLDSSIYFDKEKGRLSLKITTDPFTNGPLLKNKPYFFSITAFAVNYDEIVKFDALGTYLIPGTATMGTIARTAAIINDDKGNIGILTGDEQNDPYYAGVMAEHVSGIAEADVTYSVQDKAKTTNHTYEIGFYKDSLTIPYELFYYIKDKNTGVKLVDSTKNFLFDDTNLGAFYRDQINNLVDGITVTVPWVAPGIGSTEFEGDMWFNEDVEDTTTGGFYVGRDIAKPVNWLPVTAKVSNAITVSDLKRVELRFGVTSKAFRYVQDPNRFIWNGKNTVDLDSGFVDVPFQAWVKTETEEYQLAVGYTESATKMDTNDVLTGMPDAKYYPGNDIAASLEYIVIFNAPYSDNVEDNLIYSDSLKIGSADIGNGMRRPQNIFNDSLKAIGKSPWFNAMYVCSFETDMARDAFNPTGTFILNPGVFLTDKDKYEFNVQTTITEDDGQAQWDKVNVFPNPLFGLNEGVSYVPGGRYDEPFVTFNNLPNDVTIKLFSLSGVLVRTLQKSDATSILRWDLQNESRLRVASGMYLALISNPKYGEKVLKLAIIMPQKQILKY